MEPAIDTPDDQHPKDRMHSQRELMPQVLNLYGKPADVITAILKERDFQDQKYGHPDVNPHSVGAWLLTIEFELNEAKLACAKGGKGRDNVINEVIQIAALCVACLEQHGTNPLPGRTV